VCERAKKNKRNFSSAIRFFCETYTKDIVTDLIIVKSFGIYPMIFPFKEKGFFTQIFVFLCVIVILDC